jgi:predicted nucleic acid-binding protein
VFVDAVIAMAEPVESHYLWRPQLRDPGDELVLEAAVNGQAEAIVTFNKRDFGAAPARFGVPPLTSAEAIRRIRR